MIARFQRSARMPSGWDGIPALEQEESASTAIPVAVVSSASLLLR